MNTLHTQHGNELIAERHALGRKPALCDDDDDDDEEDDDVAWRSSWLRNEKVRRGAYGRGSSRTETKTGVTVRTTVRTSATWFSIYGCAQ